MDASQVKQEIERLRKTFCPYDTRNDSDSAKLVCPDGIVRKASVLIPLFLRNGQWGVLLTVRSKHLTQDAGYVAFPGGMSDDTDVDEVHTALREAEEEIGLNPNDVDVIAALPPGLTFPNLLVSLVLGVIPANIVPKLNNREVSMVFDLPLNRFLNKNRLRVSQFRSKLGFNYYVYHFMNSMANQDVTTFGFTSIYCIKIAVGVYQSEQIFKFMDQESATTKENLFPIDGLKLVLSKMAATRTRL